MVLYFGFIWTLLITLTSVFSANYSPTFNDAMVDIKVIAGQTAVLPCSAKNKGQHKIIWMNPKRILFSNEDVIVIDDKRVGVDRTSDYDWKLVIKHVRYNDTGEYTCQINTKPVKIKRVYLFVQVPSHILNDESSRDIDVEEGDGVKLTCKATGVPQPNITWYKRSLIAADGKDNINHEGETLAISNIKRWQSGMYICMAYNNVPPAVTRQMEIKVQYAPIVKVLTPKLGQSVGKETILECTVTSYPRAKITWIKNGMKVGHSYKYRLEVYSGEHELDETFTLSLQIRYVNKRDFGDYMCEAENRMGHSRSKMNLYEYIDPTVTVRTEAPTTHAWYTTTPSEEMYYQPDEGDDRFRSDGQHGEDTIYGIDQNSQYRIRQNNYDGSRDSSSCIRSDLAFIVLCALIPYRVTVL